MPTQERSVPPHRIFLAVLLAFIAGVVIVSLKTIPLELIGGIFILGLVAMVFWFWRWVFVGGLIAAAFAAGMFRMSWHESGNAISNSADILLAELEQNRVPVRVEGRVISFPERYPNGQRFLLRDDSIHTFAIFSRELAALHYGEQLAVAGRLRETAAFQQVQGIAYEMVNPGLTRLKESTGFSFWLVLARLRENLTATLKTLLPEPLSSYADALLLGNRAGLSQDLLEVFRQAGTTHIVALSGYNITIVASFLTTLFMALGFTRRHSFWPAVAGIAFFVLLTGASASVVRAGIMGGLVLVAYREGRRYHMINALVLAASLMLLVDPTVLLWDAGFQLSFAATAGIVFLGRSLTEKMKNVPNPWGLRDAFIATVVAQIAVLPLVIYHFGAVSIIAPLVNLLVLPLLTPIMALGYLTLGIGLFLIPASRLFAVPLAVLLSYQLWVMALFAKIPWARAFSPRLSLGVLLTIYILGALGVFLILRRERKKKYALLFLAVSA